MFLECILSQPPDTLKFHFRYCSMRVVYDTVYLLGEHTLDLRKAWTGECMRGRAAGGTPAEVACGVAGVRHHALQCSLGNRAGGGAPGSLPGFLNGMNGTFSRRARGGPKMKPRASKPVHRRHARPPAAMVCV